MRFFQSLGAVLWAWGGTLRLVFALRIWSPLLLVTLLRVTLLLGLLFFHRPEISEVAAPVVGLVGGEEATHYPDHLFLLLRLYLPLEAAITVLAGSLAAGAVTQRFARAFGSRQVLRQWKGPLRHYRPLLLLFGLVLLAEITIGILAELVPDEVRNMGTPIRLGLLGLEWGIRLGLHVCLAYAVAEIVIGSRGLRSAIEGSARLARRLPALTVVLITATTGLMFPFFVMANIDLGDRIPWPEAVAVLAGVQILAELLLTYLRIGTVTRVYVWQTEVKR